MNDRDFQYLAAQLNLNPAKVKTVHTLFAEGATVPFVARYRKEMTALVVPKEKQIILGGA